MTDSSLQNFKPTVYHFRWVNSSNLEPDPLLIILGSSESTVNISFPQKLFLSYCLIEAKICILTHWKKTTVLTIHMWLEDLINTLHLEKIHLELGHRDLKMAVKGGETSATFYFVPASKVSKVNLMCWAVASTESSQDCTWQIWQPLTPNCCSTFTAHCFCF